MIDCVGTACCAEGSPHAFRPAWWSASPAASSPPSPQALQLTGRCMHATSARCRGAPRTRSGTLSHSLQCPHSLDLCFFVYRALYARDIGALLGGSSNKNLPNMRNLAMELRKLCCHPVRHQDVWGAVGNCGQGVNSLHWGQQNMCLVRSVCAKPLSWNSSCAGG